jgi:protein SCO1/2
MAKGKWQMANGRKGNLKFAFCHLPFAMIFAVLAVHGVPALQAQSSRSSSVRPPILRNVGIDQKLDQLIPLDLEFYEETGKSVRLGDYFGRKPVILSLVYYDCPMLCTMVLNGLLEALKQLKFSVGDQFNVVTVSFDPSEKPSLAAAKKAVYVGLYGRRGASENWHFLTGDEKVIRQLTQAVGFRYNYDPQTKQYVHATGIMVLTPEGRLARYFYGIKYPSGNLRLGLVEASQGKIGSPVDEILLYCCQYDPQTGRYSLIISRAIKVAAGITVLCLGMMILVLFRGGPRQDSGLRMRGSRRRQQAQA